MANEEMIQKHLDNFLAKIAGETPVDDTVRNSLEFWLNQIAEAYTGIQAVVANPAGAGSADLTKLQVGSTVYDIPQGTEVEANPSGTGSADLTKLQVGSTVYDIPQGTEVEANPSGTGSIDLTKLMVGSTIYNIPSGGGGDSFHESGFKLTDTSVMAYTGRITGFALCRANGSYGIHKFDIWDWYWKIDDVATATKELTNVTWMYITNWYGHDFSSESGSMHDAVGNAFTFGGLGTATATPNKLIFFNSDVTFTFVD